MPEYLTIADVPHPRFTGAEADQAADVWGMNCGPAALAVMLGLTLQEVRPHLGDFEQKRYTNPTLMFAALDHARAQWKCTRPMIGTDAAVKGFPRYGLARIQWEGPWTQPGVPMRVRYRHTHWVGTMALACRTAIFDINCLAAANGWVGFKDWHEKLVPWLLAACEPKANGGWHITHSIEIFRPAFDRTESTAVKHSGSDVERSHLNQEAFSQEQS